MSPLHQPYVKAPEVLFPFDKINGPNDVLDKEILGYDSKIGYDTLWVPTGVLGSPLFDSHLDHTSYLDIDFDGKLAITNAMSILMWVNPSFPDLRTLFVRTDTFE